MATAKEQMRAIMEELDRELAEENADELKALYRAAELALFRYDRYVNWDGSAEVKSDLHLEFVQQMEELRNSLEG